MTPTFSLSLKSVGSVTVLQDTVGLPKSQPITSGYINLVNLIYDVMVFLSFKTLTDSTFIDGSNCYTSFCMYYFGKEEELWFLY